MRIFLATADVDEVRWAKSNGLIDGVVTTPTLLAEREQLGDPRELLGELCRANAGPVAAAVGAVNARDIYRDAKELAKISDHVVVQIPLVEDAIGAIRRLSAEGVRVSATLVFTAAQAVLAAKVGASAVITGLDQLDAVGAHSIDVIREIRAVFDVDTVSCDVVAAFPKDATQFADCALAGADVVILAPAVLHALLVHPLTDRGVDQLLNELSRHARPRVAT
jgi:transaldolase